jgi:hypothetical protein
MKSDYGRVFGCYSPEKWRDLGGNSYEVKKGNTFVFYFDKLKIRVCYSKK